MSVAYTVPAIAPKRTPSPARLRYTAAKRDRGEIAHQAVCE
jgi:hypothetical protein